jgi:hypothetical protein
VLCSLPQEHILTDHGVLCSLPQEHIPSLNERYVSPGNSLCYRPTCRCVNVVVHQKGAIHFTVRTERNVTARTAWCPPQLWRHTLWVSHPWRPAPQLTAMITSSVRSTLWPFHLWLNMLQHVATRISERDTASFFRICRNKHIWIFR